MCLFRRKKVADKTKEDKELINENEMAVDALIILAGQAGDENLVKEFKLIKEKIKYLIASGNSKVYDFDKKIKNLIGDLRIVMVKNDSEVTAKADKLILQINLAIIDRNTKM